MEPRAYLERLQNEAHENHTRELYLWPRTPISNLQAEIWQRCGASDWTKHGRAGDILRALADLRANHLIPESFSLVDICCGDALIPWHAQRIHPFSQCYGIDLNAGQLDAHDLVQRQGVELFRIPIQRLFRSDAGVLFDVALMFNTYRGWDSADLEEGERWIVGAADDWFRHHAHYTIVTASEAQIERLKDDGWWVVDIGRGEDDSRMILMWPCATGPLEGLWQNHRAPS